MLKRTNDKKKKNKSTRSTTGALFPLEASGIGLRADGKTLLDSISFKLTGDTKTVILGPNGAGKSLLLRLLNGLLTPTLGTLSWSGCATDDAFGDKFALVFQKPVLLRRSAEANIRFVLEDLTTAERDERTNNLLRQAGLTQHAKTPARRLSGGEQQRLAIARALATQPEVLFLDEPCASLDPSATKAIEDLIETAHCAGTKIIMVTHDLGQAKRLGDDILFLHGGKLMEHTKAEDFFPRPKTTPAQAFLAGEIVI
ncbi:MAG: ATP-binding cassette domain-containing protein [Hyphomicrobiaceae bacterium]